MTSVVLLALLVEAVVQNISWVAESKFNWQRVAAIVLSVGVCVLAGMDVFALLNIPLSVPYVGAALTGFIVARGANFVNDLFGQLAVKFG